jgi:deazaflavin-dependent oxidoreductase (nitroreductase family)
MEIFATRSIATGVDHMANWLWFGNLHRAAYRATGGILGGNLVGLPMLLLTTVGRKSGQQRTTPLPYLRDGESFVVVGSNNGGPRDPHWWLNLKVSSTAEVQVMKESFTAKAQLATGEERARLWPLLVAFNSPFGRYEKMTDREIPVVVLTRT